MLDAVVVELLGPEQARHGTALHFTFFFGKLGTRQRRMKVIGLTSAVCQYFLYAFEGGVVVLLSQSYVHRELPTRRDLRVKVIGRLGAFARRVDRL